jgi:hypothetical protein
VIKADDISGPVTRTLWAGFYGPSKQCQLQYATALPVSSSAALQVVKNAKQTQARKTKAGYADDDTKPAEEPKRWSDYTVSPASSCYEICSRISWPRAWGHVHKGRNMPWMRSLADRTLCYSRHSSSLIILEH